MTTIDAVLVPVDDEAKRRSLVRLIGQQAVSKAIIFANRKREVSSLTRYLQGVGLNARDIHGDLEQVHRQATLDAFKADQVDYLVATDVAARGLDISDMPVVINYDVPFNPDDYVHRIGRTGRAGKSGRAFTLATSQEGKSVAAIERLTGRAIPKLDLPVPAWAWTSRPASRVRRPRSASAAGAPARPDGRAPCRQGAGGSTPRAPCHHAAGAPADDRTAPQADGAAGPARGRVRRAYAPLPPEPGAGRCPAEGAGRLMQTIFVMVKCELGRAYDVADAAVQNIAGEPVGGQASEVYSISGQYDLLLKFHLDDEVDIGRFVTTRGADPARGQGHLHPDHLQGVHLTAGRTQRARVAGSEILTRERLHDGFYQLDRLRLRHERFDGAWTPPLVRELLVQRAAVAVLPFDPRREVVVLVEQFRAGCLDLPGEPWLLEAVAGLTDGEEAAEDVARRELAEETGLAAGRLIHACDYHSSPGGTSERVSVFIAEVDRSCGRRHLRPRPRARGHPHPRRPARDRLRPGSMLGGSSPRAGSCRCCGCARICETVRAAWADARCQRALMPPAPASSSAAGGRERLVARRVPWPWMRGSISRRSRPPRRAASRPSSGSWSTSPRPAPSRTG